MLLNGTLFRGQADSLDWAQIEASAPCLDEASLLAHWEGSLWIGGSHGVGRLDLDHETWACYTPASGMLDQEFQQLVPTEDALWFGHVWYGVWRYRER